MIPVAVNKCWDWEAWSSPGSTGWILGRHARRSFRFSLPSPTEGSNDFCCQISFPLQYEFHVVFFRLSFSLVKREATVLLRYRCDAMATTTRTLTSSTKSTLEQSVESALSSSTLKAFLSCGGASLLLLLLVATVVVVATAAVIAALSAPRIATGNGHRIPIPKKPPIRSRLAGVITNDGVCSPPEDCVPIMARDKPHKRFDS